MAMIILLFFILTIIYAFIIGSYKKWWNALPEHTLNSLPVKHSFISVIIAARNEENNIRRLLDSLLAQQYPAVNFEVIIIDDHSEDGTWSILQQYASIHSYIRPILLSEHMDARGEMIAYKKKAIEIGIAQSHGELIVTTDADCVAGQGWLIAINDFYQQTSAKCFAAPVRIEPGKTFLSIFQSIDFLVLQGITAGAVHGKIHMMCNGANFIYEKNAFYEVNGFVGIDKIPSGDDMLLMHKIYEKNPTKVHYLKSKDAIITTSAAESWKAFFMQRIRWASKSGHYQDKKIMYILAAVYLYNVFFLLSLVMVLVLEKGLVLWFAFLLLKILLEFPFVQVVARFFGLQKLLWYFPFMQPMHILYTIIAGWLGKFGSYEWKKRKVAMHQRTNETIK